MVQFLIFHHREKRWFGEIRPHYKKGGIIEVYADGALIDRVNRRSHLRVVRVKGNMFYDEGMMYRHKRILLKKLPRSDRIKLRRQGTVGIYKDVFYKAIEGEK